VTLNSKLQTEIGGYASFSFRYIAYIFNFSSSSTPPPTHSPPAGRGGAAHGLLLCGGITQGNSLRRMLCRWSDSCSLAELHNVIPYLKPERLKRPQAGGEVRSTEPLLLTTQQMINPEVGDRTYWQGLSPTSGFGLCGTCQQGFRFAPPPACGLYTPSGFSNCKLQTPN